MTSRDGLHPPCAAFVSTGGGHATQMLDILRHAAGQDGTPITAATGLRSPVENRWRQAAKAAGKRADLKDIRAFDPDLAGRESWLPGSALRQVVEGLPEGGRALVVGHSPTTEAAVPGLTGQVVPPLGKGTGVLLAGMAGLSGGAVAGKLFRVNAVNDDHRALERLKARYCRTLDHKDWAAFRGCFTDDFVGDTSAAGGIVIEGADEFVAFVSRMLGKAVTVHQVQQPEIDLTSPTSAAGTWAMLDVVRFRPGITLHGFGHYLETYQKADGEWRIASSRLTRLHEEIRTPFISIFVSDRLRRLAQRSVPGSRG